MNLINQFQSFAVTVGDQSFTVQLAAQPIAEEAYHIDPSIALILISPDVSPDRIPLAIADATAAAWAQAITSYAYRLKSAWHHWDVITSAIDEDAIDAEEIGPVLSQFDQLVRLGVRFDPTFAAGIQSLQLQASIVLGEAEHDDEGPDVVGAANATSNVFCADSNHQTAAVNL